MDRNLQKEFLELFPTGSGPVNPITPQIPNQFQSNPIQFPKTSVQKVLNPPNDFSISQEFYNAQNQNVNGNQKPKLWIRKLVIAFLIGCVGAIVYSTFAYTFCDNIFDNCSITLFADDGQPKITVIALHTLIFILAIYFILSMFKVQ